MKKLIFILLITFSVSTLFAQESYFRVITCKGEVYHKVSEDELKMIIPGIRIEASGELILSEGSMIKMICKDRPQKLQAAGTYNLQELFYTSDIKTMSFTGKFWKYLMDGLRNSDDKEDLKKYGNQLASGGIKGYNNPAKNPIRIISPIFGNISQLPLEFEWKSTENDKTQYTFIISDDTHTQIYKQETNKPSVLVSSEDLDMKEGLYFWQIQDGDLKSSEVQFSFEPNATTKIMDKLNLISDYVEGDEMEKSWIEAVVYEMEGFHYEAGRRYKKLMDQNPDDLLLTKLYTLHLTRIGNLESALKMVN